MDPETQTARCFLLIGGGAGLSIGAVAVIIICAYLRDRKLKRRPRIVCFCGSSRFVAEMAVLAWEYEKAGYIALGLHLMPDGYGTHYGYGENYDHLAELQGVKDEMDAIHKRKVEMANLVYIVNKGGYIGESTRSELLHAVKLGKEIKFLEKNSTSQMTIEELRDAFVAHHELHFFHRYPIVADFPAVIER